MSLPSSVHHLRIGCPPDSTRHSMALPALFDEIKERCTLSSLTIENSLLERSDINYVSRYGYMLNCKTRVQDQINTQFLEMKYAAENQCSEFLPLYHHFPTLEILSLRYSVFAVEDIFPRESVTSPESKIKVLDLTYSLSTLDRNFFSICKLPCLEELYLSGTAVTINGVWVILKNVCHLKVLDLDDTVVGKETFSVLKRYGKKLVHLYLGGTAIKNVHLAGVGASCFPNLRGICLRRTRVTQIGIDRLMSSLPSLKYVFLPRKNISLGWLLDEQNASLREKLIDCETEHSKGCNHFFENRYNEYLEKNRML